MTIGNIALKPEHKNLKLTFGCCKYSGNFDVTSNIQLFMGGDGSSQVPVSYTRSTTNDWALATAVFTLTEVPEKLTIRFVSDDYNIRMDDITLTTTDQTPTQSITFPKVMNYPWAELPVKVENADYKYITHYAETIRTKQRVRNYTACYDTRRHNPLWVAYPNHACYQEGGYARTKPDPWRPDPQLTTDQQSVIYGKDWADWPWSASGGESTDLYQYWTLFNGISFTRGHLLASANRGGAGSELNKQTFQASNIAPEEYLYEEHWDSVEIMLSDYWTCADTIYVVAGCYYGDDSKTCYDAASWNDHSALSKQCVIPEARYKVFLRTKSGSTGKNIAQCTADELMAIGVWFPQNLDGRTPAYTPPLSDYVMSVADIELKLGGTISFFSSAPADVKETYNISDWPEWSK